MLQLVCLCLMAGALPPPVSGPVADEAPGERWAVIVVGLAGDDEHQVRFEETADACQKWLTETLDFSPEHVLRLPARQTKTQAEKVEPAAPLTADTLRTSFADLGKKLTAGDVLWVFTLGHGNYDGRRAWFHLAGRDPSAEDIGRWLNAVPCRDQVVWLTHSSSGWFVKPLSKPGRIVIAATAADDESNETEFPAALAEVCEQPPEGLDTDGDARVSIAELFTAVTRQVEARFKSDNRLPTEHAQIDDDGDGRGSEALPPVVEAPQSEAPLPEAPLPKGSLPKGPETGSPASQPAIGPLRTAKADGNLARSTFVPFRAPLKTPAARKKGGAGES